MADTRQDLAGVLRPQHSMTGYGVDGASERSGANLENPSVSLVDPQAWRAIFGDWSSAAGIPVDNHAAMTVPAIWCAVNFLTGCIAHLPLRLHKTSKAGPVLLENTNLGKMLSSKVNDEYLSSFNWRRDMMTSTLLNGRGMTYIERYSVGDARYMWPLPFQKTVVKRQKGKLSYNYRDSASSRVMSYGPADVIDIKMLGDLDGVGAFNPVMQMKDTIGLAIALRQYASRFFQKGGVPPLAMEGPAASPAAVQRAKTDAGEAVKQTTRDADNILYLPVGHKLTPIGFNPEKAQMLDSQRFIVEEVSRMYNLPPSFLHSLLNMPFATVEQQDLNLVKHCVLHWVKQWEIELNMKLYGSARGRYVAFDLDELLRGDFVSRMAAYASAVTGGIFKPNEARRREGLPDADGGDRLYMNGAVVPIDANDPASTGDPAGDTPDVGDPQSDPDTPDDPGAEGDDKNPVLQDDSLNVST